jgi:hypothetical protein
MVCGIASGTTAADATDDDDEPKVFMLFVVNVYEVPFVRLETVHDPDEPVTVQVSPPGDAVIKYEVTVPRGDGAVTVTVAPRLIATAVGCPGVLGQPEFIYNPKSALENLDRLVTLQTMSWLPKRLVPVFVVSPLPTVTVCSVT